MTPPILLYKLMTVDLPQRLAQSCELGTAKPQAVIANVVKQEVAALLEAHGITEQSMSKFMDVSVDCCNGEDRDFHF